MAVAASGNEHTFPGGSNGEIRGTQTQQPSHCRACQVTIAHPQRFYPPTLTSLEDFNRRRATSEIAHRQNCSPLLSDQSQKLGGGKCFLFGKAI